MAHPSTLFRFRIELSDVDRAVYETLDLRVAMHPSETPVYLITRVLAYALNARQGLEFSPGGLSDPDQPCLRVGNDRGGTALWVEIGNPSARKLHKAAKAADEVKVYTHKDATHMLRELASEKVHRLHEIGIFSFSRGFLDKLADGLERDNRWSILHNEGSLNVQGEKLSVEGELVRETAE